MALISAVLVSPRTIYTRSPAQLIGCHHRLGHWQTGWMLGILASALLVSGAAAQDQARDAKRAQLALPRFPIGTTLVTINNGIAGDGRLQVVAGRGGETSDVSIDPQGSAALQNIMFELNHYVDVGAPGGAVQLGATTILQEPTLTGPNQVTSRGKFLGTNDGNTITWTAVSSIAPGSTAYVTTLTFSSPGPLSPVRVIQYADIDVPPLESNNLIALGTFNTPSFQLLTVQAPASGSVGLRMLQPQVTNAGCAGWAARPYFDLGSAITGSGAAYSPGGAVVGLSSTTDSRFPGSPAYGPADITSAIACDLSPTATSATVVFTVSAEAQVAAFNYTLANSGGVTATAGAAGTTTVTATLQTGSTQAVSFSASGLPSGATAAFTPGSCSPTCSTTLTLSTLSSTPTGTFPVTVTSNPLGKTTLLNLVVNPPFNYTLANSGGVTATAGAAGTTTITATLQTGPTQAVSFATSGLPSGATASFTPGSCSPTCSTTLTLSTLSSTPTGTFPVTVTSNPLGKTTSFNLVVTAVPFNYTLANSGGVTVNRGASGTTTIAATLTAGTAQPVSFAASGLPGGATAAFSPASCSPTCSTTLTIATTASTPIGTFPITVTGSPLAKTTTFNLIVNTPPFNYTLASSGNVAVIRGASGATTIAATLTAGTTQPVSFAASGLPSGATGAFSLASCSPTCSTTLTIATTASTPTGTFVITVTGGPLGRTTTFNLVVSATAATVTSMSGSVQVQFQGSVLPVTSGFALVQGMEIRTGGDGRVGGGCDDGSTFTMEPDSHVFLNDSLCHPVDSGFLDLTRGAFRLARSAAADGRAAVAGEVNSVLRTPVSDAKGPGAQFSITYTQAGNTGTATTTVSSGSVDVTDASTGNVAVARPGQPVNTTGPLPRLAASVLPSSRSVQIGTVATAFATIANAPGSPRAIACDMAPLTVVPAAFDFQTTNPVTNQLAGAKATPVGIAPGAVQSYVFGLTPTGAFTSTDVQLSFACGDTAATPIVGVNTLLLTASATPVPDIVALAATPNNDGIVTIPGATGIGVFAVAAVNLGVGGPITVSADTAGSPLPVVVSVCQTNPTTSACLAPPAAGVTTTIAANATPTFGIFVAGTGFVPFDPAQNRIFVRFRDTAGDVTRGSTSVAARTQ